MYVNYNANPYSQRVGDCTVRAISKALGQDWDKTYVEMCLMGLTRGDMPSANAVWGSYLKSKGFKRKMIPDQCPECYTVKQFAEDHKKGIFILALNGHVVAVENGNYFDTWDSGEEIPIYYWEKENDKP